ncbi:MAG TPA: aminotransferase class IV, partial [Longimicrobiales bacterium]
MLVYLNGEFIAEEEARVPVDDRGFLFADGVYEVARVYDGRIFKMPEHLKRLSDGLAAIGIEFPGIQGLTQVAEKLLDENGLRSGGSTVYIQVTRGVAPRKHAFPKGVQPTVFLACKPYPEPPLEYWTNGVAAIRYPDIRWARCDIKSVALLGNVLANQAAHEVDAFEALFVRDGVVIEGSHSNFAAVVDGTLVTYPLCNFILPGITRATVLQLCGDLGVPVREGPIYDHELFQ